MNEIANCQYDGTLLSCCVTNCKYVSPSPSCVLALHILASTGSFSNKYSSSLLSPSIRLTNNPTKWIQKIYMSYLVEKGTAWLPHHIYSDNVNFPWSDDNYNCIMV